MRVDRGLLRQTSTVQKLVGGIETERTLGKVKGGGEMGEHQHVKNRCMPVFGEGSHLVMVAPNTPPPRSGMLHPNRNPVVAICINSHSLRVY